MSGLPPSGAFHNGWRGRFNAWFFLTFDRYIAFITEAYKREVFGDLAPGVIVEVGAGVGANFRFLPRGARVLAIEPNLAMQADLRDRAEQHGVVLTLHSGGAEAMPLEDGSVDDVVCSLVLCTVADPRAVLAEIRRVLRPGGRFRFIEHVAAPWWSPRRLLQLALRKPWAWLFEGCDVCRHTEDAILQAGFRQVDLRRRRWWRSVFIPVNTAIHGVAIN